MGTLYRSPPFLSHPFTRTHHVCSAQAPPPPSSQPPNNSSEHAPQQLSTSSTKQPTPISGAEVEQQKQPGRSNTRVDSTDWIASSLTRRFGLGAGLAWAGFLAFGVISEQIKTRLEVSQQESNTRNVEKEEEVALSNGIRYYELRVGGGASPRPGDFVVIDLKGKVLGGEKVFVDTFGRDKKPLALVMGSRPYSKGMCEGIEYILRTMKAGGKRRVIVPPSLGFGENGAELNSGVIIPPSATLEYIVEVERVSIAPA